MYIYMLENKQIKINQNSLNLPEQEAYSQIVFHAERICPAHAPWQYVQIRQRRGRHPHQRPRGAVCHSKPCLWRHQTLLQMRSLADHGDILILFSGASVSSTILMIKKRKKRSSQTLQDFFFLANFMTQLLFVTTYLKTVVYTTASISVMDGKG